MPHSIALPDACQWLTQSLLSPLPAPLTLDWLFDEGSLTRRLTRLSNDGFSVTPLFEGWQPLREDECAALGLAPATVGWVREVYLRGHGQPWVFARSVAARSALQGDGLHMDALGSRSLGELLFCDHAFTRQPIEVCHYPRQWLPSADQADGLWGRRSRFDRGPLSVLVAEIFLPSFWHALHDHPENC
ncbi:chorismate lyase [Pseudomonas sp. TH04]|uniref:chorismate--pyruvate lyase family protein n=1 Tax=Pseudomonas TaxID=286 RepID=UPI00084B8D36|nr:chorismate lyase [Pseudomonas sp. AP19]MBK5546343.1 chorismate lyase [Pseudomonas sp. TH04]NNB68657.1 chorismate lyase [Pseudomonas fluorescens]OEC73677.1 chorismate--pyruvate lyase [Pseudomonas sp. AP19]UEL23139.1 chorismate lyase [Pseudomonas fluorescens]